MRRLTGGLLRRITPLRTPRPSPQPPPGLVAGGRWAAGGRRLSTSTSVTTSRRARASRLGQRPQDNVNERLHLSGNPPTGTSPRPPTLHRRPLTARTACMQRGVRTTLGRHVHHDTYALHCRDRLDSWTPSN